MPKKNNPLETEEITPRKANRPAKTQFKQESIYKLLDLDPRSPQRAVHSTYVAAMQRYEPDDSSPAAKAQGHIVVVRTAIAFRNWRRKKTLSLDMASTDVPEKETADKLFGIAYKEFRRGWNQELHTALSEPWIAAETYSRELLSSIPLAYYHFACLVGQFPRTKYTAESHTRMRLIEDLLPVYETFAREAPAAG
jgi:hypothetical protein